ncbi:MAG: SPFH domain-containing protein [Peptococcaceae bacterium]|nr:SPFH domain-containing protein [Peptococcaceae bacterium]
MNTETKNRYEEKDLKAKSGMAVLVVSILLILAAIAAFIFGITLCENKGEADPLGIILIVVGAVYAFLIGWIPFLGLKVIKPNEALVLTLFGRYYGTLKREGFYFVNPFVIAVNPTGISTTSTAELAAVKAAAKEGAGSGHTTQSPTIGKKVSLKISTLHNERQKINDQLGNPIIIGVVVVWKVVNPTKAVFNVDNYKEYLSIQCDSALRNIVRLYPYDTFGDDHEKTLRASSQEISLKLKDEIQSKMEIAGIEVHEARITHLAYAPEIAAAMLQRQQASAIIDARQMIVEGAVSIVEMALTQLSQNNVVALDNERKAAMVSNLLVVLCGNRDAQPVVNSGTLY